MKDLSRRTHSSVKSRQLHRVTNTKQTDIRKFLKSNHSKPLKSTERKCGSEETKLAQINKIPYPRANTNKEKVKLLTRV